MTPGSPMPVPSTPWRALALIILAPLVALALAAGLALDARDAAQRAETAQARLAHALSRPARAPGAEAQALLVPGATAGLAGSALQALVLAAVAPSGAEVVQVAAGAVADEGPLTRLRLSLDLRGTEPQLVLALLALEGAVPLVAVDRLDLQAAGEDGTLQARLDLSAWAGKVAP